MNLEKVGRLLKAMPIPLGSSTGLPSKNVSMEGLLEMSCWESSMVLWVVLIDLGVGIAHRGMDVDA
jgi:hypothetical protein